MCVSEVEIERGDKEMETQLGMRKRGKGRGFRGEGGRCSGKDEELLCRSHSVALQE
jgi:hypothetical protein